jgi:hypothetical protein
MYLTTSKGTFNTEFFDKGNYFAIDHIEYNHNKKTLYLSIIIMGNKDFYLRTALKYKFDPNYTAEEKGYKPYEYNKSLKIWRKYFKLIKKS